MNKVIAVTGGSGLLGKEIVSHLRNHNNITINLDINIDEYKDKDSIYCDITSDHSISESFKTIINKYNRIDGLVNNAYPRTKDWGTYFENMKSESIRTNVDWQLNSSIIMCQNALKIMKKQGSGSIVNIASIYGVVGNDFTIYEDTEMNPPAEYSAIKGGMINFTRYLASLYGKYGIRVNCVSPGGIFDNQPESFVKAYINKVPIKRMGKPDDIAPAVAFLLSSDAKYITGHNLIVDGGWTAI